MASVVIFIVLAFVPHFQLANLFKILLRVATFIPADPAIDPLMTIPSGVCCKRTSVSRLVVKLHILYRCCMPSLTILVC